MNFLAKFIGTKWAMRSEDASILASSRLRFTEDEDGRFRFRKESGELDIVNAVEHRDDGIAVIKIDGSLIYRGEDAFWWGCDSYDSIQAAFDECLADDNVKGIVFDINSPGGEVNGCADLGNRIFEARGKKPYGIVARTGGMMCSAAYWIGSSCEKVFCADNGTLGSIGVLCSFSKWSEDLIKTQVVVSDLSPDKAATPDTPEGLALIKKELNDLASVFIETVARNRETTYQDVLNNYGKGAVFIGADAVKAGLADGVISLDALCKQMAQGSLSIGGGVMATENKKSAPAASAEGVDLEAIKAQAIADYKARVASFEAAFAGVEISAEDKKNFMEDESKTVADANAFALSKAKEQISVLLSVNAEVMKERDEFKAKSETAPSAASEKDRAISALEKSASAANSVTPDGEKEETSASKHSDWAKEAANKFYKKG
ncbi:Peptidase family S49 [Fibrobacter sp. UWH9]|uniref:S49 family peptidase n=1 Tax=Fibrobacter sp. UWH9 TaxID=1896213 RepID=UPI0009175BAD|nr:S49 family peptidase [Fibrobacter sp. UWH9]SHH25261.1 Peptidase family S49 [Fibrobacter sp. UWH9]